MKRGLSLALAALLGGLVAWGSLVLFLSEGQKQVDTNTASIATLTDQITKLEGDLKTLKKARSAAQTQSKTPSKKPVAPATKKEWWESLKFWERDKK